jgi:diguanylate cyclase (GGDEF)-like protein
MVSQAGCRSDDEHTMSSGRDSRQQWVSSSALLERSNGDAPASAAQAMFELSRQASSGAPLSVLAAQAVERIAEQFAVECVSLLELSPVVTPLATRGWNGPVQAELADERHPGEGVVVSALQASIAGVARRSTLCTEVLVRGRPWAVLAVHAPPGQEPGPDDAFRLGVVAHFLSTARERELANRELERLARHDALTGLPNRGLLSDRLLEAISAGRAGRSLIAVVCLDVDHFSVVNDTLGHAAGDALLTELAARLMKTIRQGEIAARYGGDKFLVMCEGLRGEEDARAEAERLRASISGAARVGDKDLVVTASAGVSIARPGSTPDELLRESDVAVYAAKDGGRARVVVFEAAFDDRLVRRLDLATDLRQALDANELVLHYQPIVRLDAGAIVSTECLVRWHHPERGLILPGEFIPVAEDSRLIIPMGYWIMETACFSARDWVTRAHSMGTSAPGVSVNLSARQINEHDLVRKVSAILDASRLPPEMLTLEITESVVMSDAEGAAAVLRRLKDLGVRLSIDDFGTGYSSLAYLKKFPVDTLKIDRSFVVGLGADHDDAVIVGAIIRLADALGMQTIAEGVETATHAEALLKLGCQYGQGFLYSKPEAYGAATARVFLPTMLKTISG